MTKKKTQFYCYNNKKTSNSNRRMQDSVVSGGLDSPCTIGERFAMDNSSYLNVCPFDCTTVVGSAKVGSVNRLTIPVR